MWTRSIHYHCIVSAQQCKGGHLDAEFMQRVLYELGNAGRLHHRQVSVCNISLRWNVTEKSQTSRNTHQTTLKMPIKQSNQSINQRKIF